MVHRYIIDPNIGIDGRLAQTSYPQLSYDYDNANFSRS